MSATREPWLDLPLAGVQAIEASAGTGKTFTLATLVVRLVVERGLRIAEILAVTFPEAATQELRARIRARLLLAASLPEDATADEAPEAVLTRAGERVRYSSPEAPGARYVAVCLPAFSPETVKRED